MTDETWADQRTRALTAWRTAFAKVDQRLATLREPPPTLDRAGDAARAGDVAVDIATILNDAAAGLEGLVSRLTVPLAACVGVRFLYSFEAELNLPTDEELRAMADAKHEYTAQDAADEEAEHRGDRERDGK